MPVSIELSERDRDAITRIPTDVQQALSIVRLCAQRLEIKPGDDHEALWAAAELLSRAKGALGNLDDKFPGIFETPKIYIDMDSDDGEK